MGYTAEQYLNTASNIMEERAKEYDVNKERSMDKTVTAFNVITGHNLTPYDGFLLLQILKDVRAYTSPTPHIDSLVDCISYAALKAEACEQS